MIASRTYAGLIVLCVYLTFCAVNAGAQSTAYNLVGALGIPDDHLLAFDLQAEVDNGTNTIPFILDSDTEPFVSDDPLQQAVLLSTGLASDGGRGSTSYIIPDNETLLIDSATDAIRFSFTLDVPSGKKSLRFTTQFITHEFNRDGEPFDDEATLEIVFNGDQPAPFSPLSPGKVSASTGPINPLAPWAINVENKNTVSLTFIVRDRGDALFDSALRILRVYFSDQAVGGGYTKPYPQDVKLPGGCYGFSKQLLSAPGCSEDMSFDFSLYYNSCLINHHYSRSGNKWSHSYDWFAKVLGNGIVQVKRGDGGSEYFDPSGSGYVPKYKGFYNTLVKNGDGSYTYETKKHLRYTFAHTDPASGQILLTSITDANGNHIDLSYNASHQLVSVADTRGNTAVATYTAGGTVSSITYNALVTASLSYAGNNLASFTDPNGHVTSFTYDGASRLLTGTNSDGERFVQNTYTGDRLDTQRNPHGALSSYLYIGDDILFTDFMGQVHSTTYDADNRVMQKTGPLSIRESFTYDALGNPATKTDPLGGVTRLNYDNAGNILEQQNALGHTRFMDYDSRHNLLSTTDELGLTTSLLYDASDNPLGRIDPLNNELGYLYSDGGQLERFTDANGNITRYTYTAAGDVASLQDPEGGTAHVTYDDLGRRTSVTDQRGYTTRYTYDAAGNVLTKTDPLGNTITYTYNADGKPLTISGTQGILTAYTYSPSGRELTITDALNNTVSFDYNDADMPIALFDPLGRGTLFDYDAAGRLTTIEDPLGHTSYATYDAAGRMLTVTDPNGNTTHFTYTLLGQVTSETDPLGNAIARTYDAAGRIAQVASASGRVINYGYDAAGRVTEIALPEYAITHALDPNGNQLETTGQDNATTIRTFDGLNRLLSRTDEFGNTVTVAYDGAGNLTEVIYSDGSPVHYTYDKANRLMSVTDWNNSSTHYTYDTSGNLIQKELPDGSAVHYYYDDAQSLRGMSNLAPDGSLIFSTRYSLNKAGLCVSEQVSLPLAPSIKKAKAHFIYNEANQLVHKGADAFTYDADGNCVRGIIGGEEQELVFDELSRLVQVGEDSYRYDAEGFRIEATIDGITTRYVQSPGSPVSLLLEEHDESGNVRARYVYGLDLISREDQSGYVSVYHYDRRGSTVALTDMDGRITDSYAYDPYGKIVNRAGFTPNPFTYIGSSGVVDDGNGLYNMRARYYDPALMRFIQKDPVFSGKLTDPQSLNRYAYARGNPLLFIDPHGESIIGNFLGSLFRGLFTGAGKGLLGDLMDGEFDTDALDYAALGMEALVSALASALISSMVIVFSGIPIIGIGIFAVLQIVEAVTGISVGNQIISFLYDVGEFLIEDIFTPIVDFFGDAADWFKNDFVNFFKEDVAGFFKDIGNVFVSIGKAIGGFFKRLFG